MDAVYYDRFCFSLCEAHIARGVASVWDRKTNYQTTPAWNGHCERGEDFTLAHDPRLIKNEDQIEELRKTIPNWIIHLQRPAAAVIVPRFAA
jgi:hypothetical protein